MAENTMQEINWDAYDYEQDISNRLETLTEEGFLLEVKIWQSQIDILEKTDHKKIKNRIYGWDLSIPSKYNFDFSVLLKAYSNLTDYKIEIAEYISNAMAEYELTSSAHKSLKEIAVKLYTGKDKDRVAEATYVVQPFLLHTLKAKSLLNFLNEFKSVIDFAANNLNRLMIERQSQAKMNGRALNEAHYNNLMEGTQNDSELDSEESRKPDVFVDEDGEEFTSNIYKRRRR